ncbi:hypothetical protein FH972_009560 [Carpinus fangiana]|uniref:Uncharacterized protein n=1 Tax=Carpinus fangiana TaxID=176857 RepID=A0A660KRS6_9ROSI|nr:hypothetical protein FH972_009560 [Carpinus fangiana]
MSNSPLAMYSNNVLTGIGESSSIMRLAGLELDLLDSWPCLIAIEFYFLGTRGQWWSLM